MFSRRALAVIVLSCFLFNNLSSVFFETIGENMHDRQIDKRLGKPIFSFVNTLNGAVTAQWFYTTELSRILLVGEHRVFELVRYLPLIDVISLAGPLFDNRFEHFIKHIEQSSQEQLQEAIKDAVLLSPYSTKAYAVNKLLDCLIEALQSEIVYMRDQMKHDFTWDQKSFCYMKKSVGLMLGLIATKVIAQKYNALEVLEFFDATATLGLIPASYWVLKGCYKVLATDPNACHQHLEKYEELLSFVQKLKVQLEADGFITFKLSNGCIATLKDNKLIFGE